MTTKRIDTLRDRTRPIYTQITGIEGRDYQLAFHLNQRTDFWHLSIRDQDGVSIAEGLQCVEGRPLTLGLVDPRLPPGSWVVIDTTEQHRPPGAVTFGGDIGLLFVPSADL